MTLTQAQLFENSALVCDIVACEDAYESERIGAAAPIERAQAQQVWICDRHFCTQASRNDHLSVSDIRDEFNTARRVLIQGETVLGKAINLEYGMRGLAKAREDAVKLCEGS